MANAFRDENSRATSILVSKDDGLSIMLIGANPVTHGIVVENGTTGTDLGNNYGNAELDDNGVAVWLALSATGDGSRVEVYGNPLTRALLIDNT